MNYCRICGGTLSSVARRSAGAYIVNHYIVSKSARTFLLAASTANPKGWPGGSKIRCQVGRHTASQNLPGAGVKARGISEQSIMEKTRPERPAVSSRPRKRAEAKADAKPTNKSVLQSLLTAKSSEAKSYDATFLTPIFDAKPM